VAHTKRPAPTCSTISGAAVSSGSQEIQHWRAKHSPAGARSGDKGGDANLGVWTRSDAAWVWLERTLTVDAVRSLLPETSAFPIRRHVFANLRALNFVIEGLLGEGVASSTRFDPQAKALGEWLRSRTIDIPEELL